MKAKDFHFKTLKENPAETEIPSHNLMIRSGMIRKLSSGIYIFMPLGLRVLRKIEDLVRNEMNKIGAIEILTPMVQPADLWQVTDRWSTMGLELLRFKDRNQRDYVFQPTSEEVFVEIVKNEIKSWKQLPKILYQIQTKFRDERRPRFGLLRAREFIMKDAYSFDLNTEDAKKTYDLVFNAYKKIFTELGVRFTTVLADTGAIGGSESHEFHIYAETGEDELVFSTNSDYASNIELAEAVCLIPERNAPKEKLTIVNTPNLSSCEDVAKFFKISIKKILKTIFIVSEFEEKKYFYLLLLRADHKLNESKVNKLDFLNGPWRFAKSEEVYKELKAPIGSIGPINLPPHILVIADLTTVNMSDFVIGANIVDKHYTGVNWKRDLSDPTYVKDIRLVTEGDPSPDGIGSLKICRGIEVGHTFYLGKKYSESFEASYSDQEGKKIFFEMGCYGIGVSRISAALIEQFHDEKGIKWPINFAPFSVVICPIKLSSDSSVKNACNQIYKDLNKIGIDTIFDDREERPGIMFTDWELIGIPIRITISPKFIHKEQVEIYIRNTNEKFMCNLNETIQIVKNKISG